MATAAPAATSDAAVALEGVGRAYGERVALRDVSFALPAGATVAVFGANGAGKTTLLRVLAGLLRPHAGRASVLGAELPREAYRVRGRIGLLGARAAALPRPDGAREPALPRAPARRRGRRGPTRSPTRSGSPRAPTTPCGRCRGG